MTHFLKPKTSPQSGESAISALPDSGEDSEVGEISRNTGTRANKVEGGDTLSDVSGVDTSSDVGISFAPRDAGVKTTSRDVGANIISRNVEAKILSRDVGAKIIIVLNGEETSIDANSTVRSLLAAIHLSEKNCAVEINATIVAKTAYPTTPIHVGDRVEVVRFIGGG